MFPGRMDDFPILPVESTDLDFYQYRSKVDYLLIELQANLEIKVLNTTGRITYQSYQYTYNPTYRCKSCCIPQ